MPKLVKCTRRVLCEFCDRKFADETSRDRHSREIHRKAFKLVKELRREIDDMSSEIKL